MAIYPKAVVKLIPPGQNDPLIVPRIGILHVDAGNADSLYEFFRDRSGGIEAHMHVKLNGVFEQYRDTRYEADANYKANPFALSVETQGYGLGKWTAKQLDTIKFIMLKANELDGIPLRKADTWNDPKGGWGYHTLFGAPGQWTPVAKSCPGPDRIKQFNEILVPWMRKQNATEEDDMFTDADRELLKNMDKRLNALEKNLNTFKRRQFNRYKKIMAGLSGKS